MCYTFIAAAVELIFWKRFIVTTARFTASSRRLRGTYIGGPYWGRVVVVLNG